MVAGAVGCVSDAILLDDFEDEPRFLAEGRPDVPAAIRAGTATETSRHRRCRGLQAAVEMQVQAPATERAESIGEDEAEHAVQHADTSTR